ncbi:MAG: hypothetical protein ACR2FJ_09235 [Qipengyuania sp.]
MRALSILAAMLLAGCGSEPAEQESAEDFAARVGAGGTGAEGAPAPVETTAYKAPPPPNSDVLELEQLGNISGVNLGPRAGGCAFSANGTEMLVAAGPRERALPGKATVRVDGKLLLLDAPPGGFEAVRDGTVFNGEGFSVLVTKTGRDTANMTVTDAQGREKVFDGRWVCR